VCRMITRTIASRSQLAPSTRCAQMQKLWGKHLEDAPINLTMVTSNNPSLSKKQTNSPSLMASSIDSIDGSVVLVMVNGSGQRCSRECYKCVMTTDHSFCRWPVHIPIYCPNKKLRILSQSWSFGVLKAQKQINVTTISEHLFTIDGDKLRQISYAFTCKRGSIC
jgi:hypothetical protein